MALNKTTLAAAIETAIKNIDAENDDTRKLISEAIADAVIDHIVANGVISTTVTGTAGPYPVVATGTGTIS